MIAIASVLAVAALAAPAAEPDWAAVEAAIGRPGTTMAGGVHRFAFPRSDLHVTVHGIAVRPALALGGWVAFAAHGSGAVMMGDLVVTPEELAPVLDRLLEGGIGTSAIHHHLLGESPRVLYVHVHAHGDPVQFAGAIREAVARTGAPGPGQASAATMSVPIDTAAIAQALGAAGKVNGGVLQFSVPRVEPVREGDFTIPPALGLGTALNFQPTGEGRAAVTGDFVLRDAEVTPVVKALRAGRIEVTSLHNHLLTDEPRLFFLHFWGEGPALELARTLRTALDLTRSQVVPR